MWWSVLLSAVVFNAAFLLPDYLGLCVFFFLPLLYCFFSRKWAVVRCFWAGAVWGLVVFLCHFLWVLRVLVRHSRAPLWLCFLLYVLIVFYFLLTSGAWFVVTHLLRRFFSPLISLLTSSLLYWLALEYVIMEPLALGGGYPFFNPCIPLASYTFFLRALTTVSLLFQGYSTARNTKEHLSYCYLRPALTKGMISCQTGLHNPIGLGQSVYHQLRCNRGNDDTCLFVTPESFYPFPFNRYKEMMTLWASALHDNDVLMLASLYEKQENVYQCVYCIQKGLIINIYVKKHQVPLVEKMPPFWKKLNAVKSMFLKEGGEFSDRVDGFSCCYFDIGRSVRVIPQICSEFFFKSSWRDVACCHASDKDCYIFLFVNDSWFDRIFKKLLYYLTALKASRIGLPVLYIGHDAALWMNRC